MSDRHSKREPWQGAARFPLKERSENLGALCDTAWLGFRTDDGLPHAALQSWLHVRAIVLFATAAHIWRSGRAQDTQSVKTMHLFNGHYVVGYSTMSTLRVVCMSQEWPLHDWCAPAETCY